MALALNYEKFRRVTLHDEQASQFCWLLLSALLVIGAGGGTAVAIGKGVASGVVAVCGVLTLVFIVGFGMTLSELLALKAERPADRKSLAVLIYLVDQLGNRQDFIDEIGHLLREQGELYQYQAKALILATKRQGISKENMRKLQQLQRL